jgi:hypothetical protein
MDVLLDNFKISKKVYLDTAKKNAKDKGYDPNLLNFSKRKDKKLNYNGVNFGSSTNRDFIIYSILEDRQEIAKGTALQQRKQYLARAKKIKGDWKKDKESANYLAIKTLWDG